MKLGIISQWFAPEETTLPNSLAKSSVLCGDEVVVLTAFPSYPHGVIYEGYFQRPRYSENVDGALVHRVQSFLSHDANPVNRIRSFISFALASIQRSHVLRQNDVNYVYGTPMTAAWAAWWARIRYGVPYVLHVQDLWPESVTSSGMMGSGPTIKIMDFLISLMLKPLYAAASEVVAIAPTMAQTLVSRGVSIDKVSTVLNWDSDVHSIAKDAPRATGAPLRFVYAGNLGVMQDIESIVRAAALVQDCPDIEFHIYGSGVSEESLKRLAQALELRNITFHGRVSKTAMGDIYNSSDFQFVTLKDRPLFRMTIPSKFQAALANGVPVITTVQGDLADLCVTENVGMAALPEDPASLANAVRAAAQLTIDKRSQMISNCRELYERKLSPERGITSIRVTLQRAAERS